jgi:hypothetical protein
MLFIVLQLIYRCIIRADVPTSRSNVVITYILVLSPSLSYSKHLPHVTVVPAQWKTELHTDSN